MPTLPTAQALGVRSFQDRSAVVTPTADTRGQNALVSTISNISAGMNERLDASSLHKAKINFQKAKLEADAAFDQDPDFETYQERYDKKLESAMESSTGMVRNQRDRARFQEEMSLYRAQGNQMMIAKAFGKEVDRGLADLNETLTVGRENYLRASNQQDKQFAIDTANEAINAAELATHIDSDKAQSMRQALAVDLAIASVESAPPQNQVKLLKSKEGIFNDIPLDVRTKMLKNAEAQLDAQVSLDNANEIRVAGGTLAERMAKVNKINDPKIKSSTRAQVINDHNIERTADGEERYAIYDDAAKAMIAGESLEAFISQNPKGWNRLEAKEQTALISMTRTKKATETNFEDYHKLNILKQQDKVKAYHFFLDNVSSFSASDAKKESDYFTGLGEDPKPLLSLKETFNKKAKNLGIKNDELGRAEWRIQQEYDTWARKNPGEQMGLNTQSDIVNSVFDTVVGSGFLGFNTKRNFDLPKKEADRIKVEKMFSSYKLRFNQDPDIEMQIKITDKMVRDGLISDYVAN